MKAAFLKFTFVGLTLSLIASTTSFEAEEPLSTPAPASSSNLSAPTTSSGLTRGRIKITNPHCLACIRQARNLLLQTRGIGSLSMEPDLLAAPKAKARRITINLEFDAGQTSLKKLKQLLREHDLEVVH